MVNQQKNGERYIGMDLVGYILILFSLTSSICCAQVVPLPGAHAHNDYNHDRPLLDAIAHGFTSIEVDVLLIADEIYVGHELPRGADSLPTLVGAYLQPLDSIIRQNGGALYPGYDQTCYLMIDIKTEAEATYQLLKEQLEPYSSWIRQQGKEQTIQSAVTVFLSGNRPMKIVLSETNPLVSLDGRPTDLGEDHSPEIMPVISQSYALYSKWMGVGEMPQTDQERIRDLAATVHREGKKLRLWATPEGEQAWFMLQSLGVDLINTDDLRGLREFLLKK